MYYLQNALQLRVAQLKSCYVYSVAFFLTWLFIRLLRMYTARKKEPFFRNTLLRWCWTPTLNSNILFSIFRKKRKQNHIFVTTSLDFKRNIKCDFEANVPFYELCSVLLNIDAMLKKCEIEKFKGLKKFLVH